MKLITYLLLHGLALTSHASSSIKVTANFDNLTASDIPSPNGNFGTYEYITYSAFALVDLAENLVQNIQPHTSPNAIDTESEQQSAGTPSLTVAKPYTSFGLTDFWFGCTLHTGEGAVSPPTQCTITVAAFESTLDKEVAVASFTSTPPSTSVVTPVPMIHAVLPNTFQVTGIKNVTIVQESPTTQALLLDSFTYYLYK